MTLVKDFQPPSSSVARKLSLQMQTNLTRHPSQTQCLQRLELGMSMLRYHSSLMMPITSGLVEEDDREGESTHSDPFLGQ